MADMLPSTSFFRYPSFLQGASRGVTITKKPQRYHAISSAVASDYAALKRDWMVIGQDLTAAVKAYGKSSKK